jgi:hypothetical protein
MNSVNEISEELKSMGSILADMSRSMPYSVPEGYFIKLADATCATIKDVNAPEQVPAWSKDMPYTVPAGYFNNLAADIVSCTSAEDFSSLQSKNLPLPVPVGYFDTLPGKMLAAAKATEPQKKISKTIPLANRHIFQQLRWAAAAVLLIGIGFGSYNVFFRSPLDKVDNMLASVPGNDIHDYLQHSYRVEDVDRIIGNTDVNNLQLDNKDIVQYLNETGWD